MVIFKRTFKQMLSLKFLLIYFIIYIPIFYMLTLSFGYFSYGELNSTNIVIDANSANFFLITFMWILGLPFLITTCTRSSSLIQQEIDDDTLVLLISKPISRLRIYLEKWLASFVASAFIAIVSIFISLSIYIVFFNFDSIIILKLFSMIPALILYSIFINFIFTSLSIVITLLLRNKTKAIIILIILIMSIQFIFPLLNSILGVNAYEKYKIYLFNLNYHFGIMFYYIIDLFSTIDFTPAAQENINDIVNIFNLDYFEMDGRTYVLAKNMTIDYLKPLTIFSFYIVLSVINMLSSYYILKKKDIN